MMTIKYRGFVGNLEIDLETKLLIGKVQNVRAALLYQGATVDDAIVDFHASIDEYLEDCERRGISPEQSFNGVFQVRISSATHHALATEAAEESSTLNAVIARVLDRHVAARTSLSTPARMRRVVVSDFWTNLFHQTTASLFTERTAITLATPATDSASHQSDVEAGVDYSNVRPLFPKQRRAYS